MAILVEGCSRFIIEEDIDLDRSLEEGEDEMI
jgi:hypothetical protein